MEHVGKNCPYCQTPIKPGVEVHVCPACRMPHHLECWNEANGCTTYGCKYVKSGPVAIEEEAPLTPVLDICPKCLNRLERLSENEMICPACGTKSPIEEARDERGRGTPRVVSRQTIVAAVTVIVVLAGAAWFFRSGIIGQRSPVGEIRPMPGRVALPPGRAPSPNPESTPSDGNSADGSWFSINPPVVAAKPGERIAVWHFDGDLKDSVGQYHGQKMAKIRQF